jgi:hypothetical protein
MPPLSILHNPKTMLSEFQRKSIISEIRAIFIHFNNDLPPNDFIENLWQEMSTSHLYMALGNFRRMAEREE